jgi:hypothetical protein
MALLDSLGFNPRQAPAFVVDGLRQLQPLGKCQAVFWDINSHLVGVYAIQMAY